MIGRALESQSSEEPEESCDGPPVDALPLGEGVEVVELLEQFGGGLVDGADHGAAPLGQGLQEVNALVAAAAVQSAVKNILQI